LIIGDILYKLLQPITAEELKKAVAFYSDRTKKQNAKPGDTLMHIRFDMIKNNYLFSEKALLKDLKKVNEKSFNQFVDKLLAVDKIRILTYGSYSKEEVEAISALLNEFTKKLPKPVQRDYVTRFNNRLENNKIYQLNEKRPNSDEQAFLNAYIDSKPGIESKASMIVYVMLVNASEKKIKSLGIQDHNIALSYRELGEYPAIVFSTQSKGSLQNMNESLNQYIKETYTTFERMNKYSFEEAKEDLIKQVDQTIKNLESDLNYHVSNWLHHTPEEKDRIAVIKHIEKVTLDDVKDLYKRLIKDEKGTRVIIQLLGEKSTNKDKRFKMFKDSIIIKPL
jgi:secreted Zn-dependent insulinase-like peptidase